MPSVAVAVALTIMMLAAPAVPADKPVPSRWQQIMTDANTEYAITMRKLLGSAYRSSSLNVIDTDNPKQWHVAVGFFDPSPSGKLDNVYLVVGSCEFLMKSLPIEIRTAEITIFGQDNTLRSSINLDIPADRRILDLFLKISQIESFPEADAEALVKWIGVWKIAKLDSSWTAADTLLRVSDRLKNEKISPRQHDSQPWRVAFPCMGVFNKDLAADVIRIARQKDQAALKSLLEQGLAVFLPQGTQVYIMEFGWRFCRVRVTGSPQQYWVDTDLLENPATATKSPKPPKAPPAKGN